MQSPTQNNTRALTLLFTANSISGFAQGITMLSVPWYFTTIVHHPHVFGKAYAIITLLSMGWVLYAGTLVDRYSRKRLFLSFNVAGAIVLGAVAAIGYFNGIVPQGFALIAFAFTIFLFNIHYPTLYGFGQEISQRQNYSRISSYIEVQGQMTSMLSGGMAAILLSGAEGGRFRALGRVWELPFEIKAWELHEIFLLNAAAYTLAFLVIAQIKYQPAVLREIDLSTISIRLRSGLNFLRERPYLLLFGIGSLSIFVFTLVHEYYLLSVYVGERLHGRADVYASCQFFYAIGAVFSGLFIRKILHRLHHPVAIAILILTACMLIFTLTFTKSIAIIFIFSIFLGLSNAGSRITRITYIFHQVDNNMIGRVNSIYSLSHTVQRALFIYIFSTPFFMRGEEIVYAYVVFGIYTLIAAGLLLFIRNKLPKVE